MACRVINRDYCVCARVCASTSTAQQRSRVMSSAVIDLTNHRHRPAASQWDGSGVSDAAVSTRAASFFTASRVTRAAAATETYTVAKIAIRPASSLACRSRNHISKRSTSLVPAGDHSGPSPSPTRQSIILRRRRPRHASIMLSQCARLAILQL